MDGTTFAPITFDPTGSPSWCQLVDEIGRHEFQNVLFGALVRETGADYCLLSEITPIAPKLLGTAGIRGPDHAANRYRRYLERGCWQFDPLLDLARNHASVSGITVTHQPKSALDSAAAAMIYNTDISDRLAAIGLCHGHSFMLTLFRGTGSGEFTDLEVEWINNSGSALLSIIAKHAEFLRQRDQLLDAVTSVHSIEDCLAGSTVGLTQREREVCARLLGGRSPAAIAAELRIGTESVTTYRKRALEKIGIANQRELFAWYVRSWLDEPATTRQ